jgi:cold shock protein
MGGKEPPRLEGFAQLSGLPSTDLLEVSGSIKWFDPSKGFGFIVSDDEFPEVFLHLNCLRNAGLQTIYEGARVVCQAEWTSRGLKAIRILCVDESTAILPSELPPRTHIVVPAESDWESATVKWFNRVRGFGFLTQGAGTPDIFVHMETLRRFGFTELKPGQSVMVRYGTGPNGLMVAKLAPEKTSGSFSH